MKIPSLQGGTMMTTRLPEVPYAPELNTYLRMHGDYFVQLTEANQPFSAAQFTNCFQSMGRLVVRRDVGANDPKIRLEQYTLFHDDKPVRIYAAVLGEGDPRPYPGWSALESVELPSGMYHVRAQFLDGIAGAEQWPPFDGLLEARMCKALPGETWGQAGYKMCRLDSLDVPFVGQRWLLENWER